MRRGIQCRRRYLAAKEAIACGNGNGIIAHAQAGGGEITGESVARAAEAGDSTAGQIIATAGTMLGVGVANLRHLFDPECIVIGGGMTKMGARYWEPFYVALAKHTLPPYVGAPVVFSALEDNAGLLGAASRALMMR